MAERRMVAKTIILSDAFLDMPATARCLYFTMLVLADDDGFINSPKSIMRQSGASDDDIMVLIGKKFVIPFESGVVVIKHWRIHNYIQRDRYVETKYKTEKESLSLDENMAYTRNVSTLDTECIQDVYSLDTERIQDVSTLDTQVRLGKDRLGKDRLNSVRRFTPPTIQQVADYCKERGNNVDPERFVDYYTSKDWVVGGRGKMKDWKAAVRGWEKNDFGKRKDVERSEQDDAFAEWQRRYGEEAAGDDTGI